MWVSAITSALGVHMRTFSLGSSPSTSILFKIWKNEFGPYVIIYDIASTLWTVLNYV